MARIALVVAVWWGICSVESPLSAQDIDPSSLAKSVTIYRDAWGVPHIDAPTDEGVVFGFAFAQCEDYF